MPTLTLMGIPHHARSSTGVQSAETHQKLSYATSAEDFKRSVAAVHLKQAVGAVVSDATLNLREK